MATKGPFHVVKLVYEGNELITYAVYLNNRVYLKPPRGKALWKKAAYAICELLNKDEKNWPEQPKTRAELMAIR